MMDSVRWAFNFRKWSPTVEEIGYAFSLVQLEEKERLAQFMFKKDIKASLSGRLLMRNLVASKLNMSWNSFELGRTEKGRPYLINPIKRIGDKLSFNVSHQGDFVVLASETNGPILGVDVVKIESPSTKNVSEFFRLMNRQFTSDEWIIIKSSGSERDQLKSFYRNWALKEALVKSLGVGITYDLKSLSFEVSSNLSLEHMLNDTRVKINGVYDSSWIFEESLLDKDHIVVVAHHFPKNVPKDVERDYCTFEVLTFDEIVCGAKTLIGKDINLANKFICKKEGPWEC